MTEQDNITPWQRAGGFSREEWEKVCELAHRHAAEAQRAADAEPDPLKKHALQQKATAAAEERVAARRGDSEPFGRFFDEVARREGEESSS